MGQYLKAIGGFSVEQIDNYPSGQTAFAIVSTLVCATWTDYTRRRWPVLVYMSLALILSSILILVWKTPIAVKFFAYCTLFRFVYLFFHCCRFLTQLPSAFLDLAGASYAGQATTFA